MMPEAIDQEHSVKRQGGKEQVQKDRLHRFQERNEVKARSRLQNTPSLRCWRSGPSSCSYMHNFNTIPRGPPIQGFHKIPEELLQEQA